MPTISGAVNGHPIELTRLPSFSQDNSYVLWGLYRQVLSMNSTYPIIGVTIDRVPNSVPPHFHLSIHAASGADLGLHLVFTDILNPNVALLIPHVGWSWNQLRAARGILDESVGLIAANPTLIDSLAISIVQ